ncbi:MAG: acetate--CoA ligase family protein [Candidatus Jordarchaeum sp.]|uniref:acetate--CoA ligase family protein n=1 Tax=Candidatus Jordarchaeum sp. TaxID=2823881 RepID=UPI004049D3BD
MQTSRTNNGNIYETINYAMQPRGIAVIGASPDPIKIGSWILRNIYLLGYEGKLFPINPRYEGKICGLQSYPSILDVPGEVDLAVIVIPNDRILDVLGECVKKEVKIAILVSAGFAEFDIEGRELQNRIKNFAREKGIRLIGPNCLGVVNPGYELNTTTMPMMPAAGTVGFISQSGGFAGQTFLTARRIHLGFSKIVNTGNEADLDTTDFLEYFGEDPQTRVIMMFVESIKRGHRFLELAREVSKQKPILCLKVGRTERGVNAALSHTGNLSGSHEVFKAAMQQAGVLLPRNIEEMFEWAFVFANQPLPKGNRIGIVTNSGGPGVALVDVCLEHGLVVPELPLDVQKQFREMLAPNAIIKNPVDLTFASDFGIYSKCVEIMFDEADIDGMLIYGVFGADIWRHLLEQKNPSKKFIKRLEKVGKESVVQWSRAIEKTFVEAIPKVFQVSKKYNKPIITASTSAPWEDEAIRSLPENGIPFFRTPEAAAEAMAALVQYSQYRVKQK